MGEQLSQDAVMELIRAQYPELIPILEKPGVRDALFTSVQNNYTPARLQAALQATSYYRTTPAQQRAWDILSTVDPTTAASKVGQSRFNVQNAAAEAGITLSPEDQNRLEVTAAVYGWTDAEIKWNTVAAGIHPGETSKELSGNLATQAQNVQKAASDYGVPLSDQATIDWAQKLAGGTVDSNAVNGYMIEQAKSLYPGLAGALDQGITVAQYADPYKQIATRELNLNPNDFNLSDPKWNSAISQVDPQTGNKVPMSLDQWQTNIRTDPKYNYDSTNNAKAGAAQLVNTLAQKFGIAS